MKQNYLLRLFASAILIVVGFISTLLAFGDDNLPLPQFFLVHISLLGFGIGCFYLLGKLMKKWERDDNETTLT